MLQIEKTKKNSQFGLSLFVFECMGHTEIWMWIKVNDSPISKDGV